MHCFIGELETPQLVATYKNVTGKEVKKFESRRAGLKRVANALAKKYDATISSNGECVYAPPGMQFDMKVLDFVEKTAVGVVKQAPVPGAVEKDATKVEKKAKREKSVEKQAAREEQSPAAKTDDSVESTVKTSGNPVRKEGGSPAKGRRLGIGKRMEQLLEGGVIPKEIVAKIHEEFPASRATTKDVYLIRSRMNEVA